MNVSQAVAPLSFMMLLILYIVILQIHLSLYIAGFPRSLYLSLTLLANAWRKCLMRDMPARLESNRILSNAYPTYNNWDILSPFC
ncbi:hypothetical protein D3C76_1686620 [compost metagenome]